MKKSIYLIADDFFNCYFEKVLNREIGLRELEDNFNKIKAEFIERNIDNYEGDEFLLEDAERKLEINFPSFDSFLYEFMDAVETTDFEKTYDELY